MAKRVLITGHQGYLGSVMAPVIQAAGHDVVGLDVGYFRECTLVPDAAPVPTVRKDVRDLTPGDLEGFDAVIHLAALSNDPIGNLNPEWTEAINDHASVTLARLARAAGVERFLFSSSCIMYGVSEAADVDEESPLAPQTEYARSKVRAEAGIRQLADTHFSPTMLRNGTVYGLSPRMRFDTVFNDLVGSAVSRGRVVIHSDGTPWRPVVHVQDVARLFLTVLEAPRQLVHNQVFNAGANSLNHRVMELAEIAVATVPGCELEVVAQPGADQRTYRAAFGKFAAAFPDFRFRWTVREGAEEVRGAFQRLRLTHEQMTDRRFVRLKWLRHLLDSGRLDAELRWAPVVAAT
jgi:nucleoside-diphosphate-sugar epimerase